MIKKIKNSDKNLINKFSKTKIHSNLNLILKVLINDDLLNLPKDLKFEYIFALQSSQNSKLLLSQLLPKSHKVPFQKYKSK